MLNLAEAALERMLSKILLIVDTAPADNNEVIADSTCIKFLLLKKLGIDKILPTLDACVLIWSLVTGLYINCVFILESVED